MARRILVNLQPFDKHQVVYVFENNEKIDELKTETPNVDKAIFRLTSKYNIADVYMRGPKQYIRGLIKKMKKEELTEYGLNIIKFIMV